jgi:hypothetical protein
VNPGDLVRKKAGHRKGELGIVMKIQKEKYKKVIVYSDRIFKTWNAEYVEVLSEERRSSKKTWHVGRMEKMQSKMENPGIVR